MTLWKMRIDDEIATLTHSQVGTDSGGLAIGLELIGNPGLSKKNPLERHYRDVLCSRIHTPQNDAICLSLGKSALKITT
ncbi:hypothetical protein [Nostoc flagelliforme]|uniref:hypothetical protein n=1 Tax=Nostoc flagelliforme TaxID=1306274 RepID=UPI001F555346|nr:hypothetical protein [Nostoc flagelliforme]